MQTQLAEQQDTQQAGQHGADAYALMRATGLALAMQGVQFALRLPQVEFPVQPGTSVFVPGGNPCDEEVDCARVAVAALHSGRQMLSATRARQHFTCEHDALLALLQKRYHQPFLQAVRHGVFE